MPRGGKAPSKSSSYHRSSIPASTSSFKAQDVSTTVASVLEELKSLMSQIQVSTSSLRFVYGVHHLELVVCSSYNFCQAGYDHFQLDNLLVANILLLAISIILRDEPLKFACFWKLSRHDIRTREIINKVYLALLFSAQLIFQSTRV